VFFFFSSRRRHTRLQGDWSSDVCSSDLNLQPLENPRWRRRNLHVANHASRVAPAAFGILYFNGERLSGGPCLGQLRLDRLECDVVERRTLAGYPVMIHGVGTVGSDLHLKDSLTILLAHGFHRHSRESEVVSKLKIVDR